MKIQIWGKSKCFDTKKAERYFKERRIPYQAIDLLRYGMSRGELTSVKNAVGLDTMLNPKAADYALVQHLAYEQDKIERLLEDPSLLADAHRPQRPAGHRRLLPGCVEDVGIKTGKSPIWRWPYRAFCFVFNALPALRGSHRASAPDRSE